jgi:molybdopterin-guanine dinucleotide biosynthesis protein A
MPPVAGLRAGELFALLHAHGVQSFDKAFIEIGGQKILDRVLARLQPSCRRIVLNANGDPQRFASWGLPVIADSVKDFAGPLAGILAGMDWTARNYPAVEWMASVPGDCPFLPEGFVERLHEVRAAQNRKLACAQSGDWRHPVVGLWNVRLREDLRKALLVEDLHKIEVWTARHGVAIATWPDTPIDPFFNVNTPEDVAQAEKLAAR